MHVKVATVTEGGQKRAGVGDVQPAVWIEPLALRACGSKVGFTAISSEVLP